MTALALRDDQTYWDETQLAVLRGSGIDEGVTEAELTAFLHECQRRRLDPFTRQIYLIGRWDNKKKRNVYRSQTSIDGFRLIARRAADEAKESIEYEETIWYDADGGKHEVWLGDEPPAACKVVVLRNGKRFPATARFASYVQLDRDGNLIGLWKKMPDGQIGKCVEALALRKAFPEELGGIYAEEEMAQADNPQRVTASVEVVRDERMQAAAGEEDQEWAAQVALMSTFGTEEEGQALWAAVVQRRKDGKLNPAGDKRLKEIIKARWAELNAEAKQGTIVQPLDPADPWAAKVDEITSDDDAALLTDEVSEAERAGDIDADKAASIHAAIAAKAEKVEAAA